MVRQIFNGVYSIGTDILTKNAVKGQRVYGEKLIFNKNVEYRKWDPYRSKLAAAIKKGLKTFAFNNNTSTLYLGASTGTTISHLSDICIDGVLYGVEVSAPMVDSLMEVAEERENIIPILADARKPSEYADVGEVDVVYQDVSQPDLIRIFILNIDKFLKKGGNAYIALKTHSIDVTMPREQVLKLAKQELEKHYKIEQVIDIAPYDSEHYFIHVIKE